MAQVPDNEDTLKKCICGGCPSYTGCMKDKTEALYCARGKSECEVTQKGCLCGACPLASQYNLAKTYYCEAGAAE
jgi:hypothetical protein